MFNKLSQSKSHATFQRRSLVARRSPRAVLCRTDSQSFVRAVVVRFRELCAETKRRQKKRPVDVCSIRSQKCRKTQLNGVDYLDVFPLLSSSHQGRLRCTSNGPPRMGFPFASVNSPMNESRSDIQFNAIRTGSPPSLCSNDDNEPRDPYEYVISAVWRFLFCSHASTRTHAHKQKCRTIFGLRGYCCFGTSSACAL